MESQAVRALVEVFYDLQKTRIAAEHRIRKAGEHGLDAVAVTRMSDWLKERMDKQEAELKSMILQQIKNEPLWRDWLKGVKGVGPCIAGGLMAWLGDCSRFETVSKLWAYCGMHVADGQAPKRKKGEKGNWNPTMRTLCWKAAQSFVRVGEGYRALYDQEKTRLRGLHPEPIPYDPPRFRKKKPGDDAEPGQLMKFSDGHIDAMARRKVAKVLLAHYWEVARTQAGLPVRAVYVVEVLGHTSPIPVVMQ